MNYHESGACQECGAILETEYEVDEGLCTDCYHQREEEDPYEHEEDYE